jgi:hypothetical protein
MGQVIDLPDPLNNAAPAASPGVDDLLAQLAGEEIDRLLAEADVERPVQPAVTIIPPGAISVASEAPVEVHADAPKEGLAPSAADPEQLAAAPEPSKPPSPIRETDVEELDARVAKELNNLFTELDTEKPSAVAQPVAAATSAPIVVPAAPAAAAVAQTAAAAAAAVAALAADPVAQAQELEKQVLGQNLLDALGGPEEAEPAKSRIRSINFWFLLKPLEWVNAPLSACSDTVRESLGKVAIMTLINALAILLYVMFLRKH